MLTSLVLFGLVDSRGYVPQGWAVPLLTGLAVSLALGLVAHRLRAVDISGLVAGVVLGVMIWLPLGPRGFHVGVPALAAVFAATTPHPELFVAAFVAALASAAGDTVSSETGQLWGERTVSITTFRPVPPGTDGGISLPGTLAGSAASLTLAVLGWLLGFYPPRRPGGRHPGISVRPECTTRGGEMRPTPPSD